LDKVRLIRIRLGLVRIKIRVRTKIRVKMGLGSRFTIRGMTRLQLGFTCRLRPLR
jgi:hypothetical protein